MAEYQLGVRTTITTTGAACAELRAGATKTFRLLEVGVTNGSAVASSFGLGVAAAAGVTPTSVVLMPSDPDDPDATAGAAIAWGGTVPTVPTKFYRRGGSSGSIGAGVIWTFGKYGLILPPATQIVLWNFQTNAVFDVVFLGDE